MFIWLGSVSVAVSARTGVARATAGYLTSVLINGDPPPPNWLELITEFFKAFVEALKLLGEKGLGLLKPLDLVVELLEGKAAERIDEAVVKLLEQPGELVGFVTALLVFLVSFGLLLLSIRFGSYLIRIGTMRLQGWTAWQIFSGRAGLTAPHLYIFTRLMPAFLVLVVTPGVYTAMWQITNFVIAQFVKVAYGSRTFGEVALDILAELLDTKTVLYLLTGAPVIVAVVSFFLLVYLLLNLFVVFTWIWMILKVAQYGDGVSGSEVITDTAGWAIKSMLILGLMKFLVWLSPVAIQLMGFVSPTYSIPGWLLFVTLVPFLLLAVFPIFSRIFGGAVKNITLHHVIHPVAYTPTQQAVVGTAKQTVSKGRALYHGAKMAVQATRLALKV